MSRERGSPILPGSLSAESPVAHSPPLWNNPKHFIGFPNPLRNRGEALLGGELSLWSEKSGEMGGEESDTPVKKLAR